MDYGLDTDALLRSALAEDLGDAGDVTTRFALGDAPRRGHGTIRAKAHGRLSGVALGVRVFALVDDALEVVVHRGDGEAVAPGDVVLEAVGSAASLLIAERTVLNVMQQWSGVASLTAQFVERCAGTRARVVDTRKTPPCWRTAAKAAVVHGGGENHRIGLYDQVLLKENHFATAGGTHREVVERVVSLAPKGMTIIAEAQDLAQAEAIADGGAQVILLDNFDVDGLFEAVKHFERHPRRDAFELEASGGVNLDTVAAIARTGVDRISVGALTHSAPALDLSMLLDIER